MQIFQKQLFGIPSGVIIFFLAAILAHIILNKTIVGRFNFAIGSNLQATRLSGINTERWLIIIHSLTGAFVGLAGVLMAARLNSAQPALGQGYELDAIAAVVIGGTSLSGVKEQSLEPLLVLHHECIIKWITYHVCTSRMANSINRSYCYCSSIC